MKFVHKYRAQLRKAYLMFKYSYRFPIDYIFCLYKLGFWNPSWRFYRLPIIKKHRQASISIGNHLSACSSPHHNSLGVFQRVTIKALAAGAQIKIGDNVGMSGNSIACALKVTIGNHVLIGSGAVITDNDAHPINYWERHISAKTKCAEVVVEDHVFIGARAIILKGVTLGIGSVVGAGAVVSKDVAAFTIVGGNPAKVVGHINISKS